MIKRRFAVSDGGRLAELPENETPSDSGEGLWVDVEDFAEEELTAWLASLDFSQRAVHAAAMLRGRSRTVSVGEEVFFEFPALASDIGSERVPLAFLCRPGLCVTVHRGPVQGLAKTAKLLSSEEVDVGANTSSMVAALLAGLSGRAVDAVDEMRRQVLAMQDQMDCDPGQVDVTLIHSMSSASRTLDAVIGERIVILDRLRLTTSPDLDLEDNRDFELAMSDARYVDRVVGRIEKRLANLREQYGLHQQDRTNRRLAVLTVLSAVFLPLTLIAGIYGMNFEVMPELGYRYSYPMVIGAMALLALGMIGWFRSHKWFE
jgi:magnesium transporter